MHYQTRIEGFFESVSFLIYKLGMEGRGEKKKCVPVNSSACVFIFFPQEVYE